jgi:hypothetical protein
MKTKLSTGERQKCRGILAGMNNTSDQFLADINSTVGKFITKSNI